VRGSVRQPIRAGASASGICYHRRLVSATRASMTYLHMIRREGCLRLEDGGSFKMTLTAHINCELSLCVAPLACGNAE
jgi:hypothetical protein